MDFDVRLGEMNCSIAKRHDGSGCVGIELVEERELGVAYDARSLLRARLHYAHQCRAVDVMLLTVGVVLGGRMQKLGHTPHALPITCGRRAAVEGREGSGRLRCMAV